jgi:hypothetical protein
MKELIKGWRKSAKEDRRSAEQTPSLFAATSMYSRAQTLEDCANQLEEQNSQTVGQGD